MKKKDGHLQEITVGSVTYVWNTEMERVEEAYGKPFRGEIPPRDGRRISEWPNPLKNSANKGEYNTGHIVARNLGGPDDGINFMVQNAETNGGAYERMEAKAASPDARSFHIVLRYEGRHADTDIPSHIEYTVMMKGGEKIRELIDNTISHTSGVLRLFSNMEKEGFALREEGRELHVAPPTGEAYTLPLTKLGTLERDGLEKLQANLRDAVAAREAREMEEFMAAPKPEPNPGSDRLRKFQERYPGYARRNEGKDGFDRS